MMQRLYNGVARVGDQASVMVLGLIGGVALMAAWHAIGQGMLGQGALGQGALPWGTQVQATATHGESNFAIATGWVDEGVEALYFLDFLTGDLRAAVVSRRTGEFVAFFERNIQQDFAGSSKNPKYLMVTGRARIPVRGVGNTEIGNSLIYVAEVASGEVAAYALPWNQTLSAKGQAQRGGFLPLAKGSFRTTFVRDDE